MWRSACKLGGAQLSSRDREAVGRENMWRLGQNYLECTSWSREGCSVVTRIVVCRSALFWRRSRSLGFWGPVALWPLTLQAGITTISRRESRGIPKLLTWSVNCEIGLTTYYRYTVGWKSSWQGWERRRHNKLTSAAGREGGWVAEEPSSCFPPVSALITPLEALALCSQLPLCLLVFDLDHRSSLTQ